ncbi:MAG: hypothetical protein V2I24_09355 [Halieaceae bacterium]|jgi:hypothetical protein|nr:hypothetical protein [Halieaceae bacterium]
MENPAWSGLFSSEAGGDGGDPGAGAGAPAGGEPGKGDGGEGGAPAGGAPTTYTLEQLRSTKPVELLSDDDLKADPTIGNITDIDSMARMLRSAQQMVGNPKNFIRRLGENATDAERQAFFREIGAPEKPEEYGLPAGLERPEDMPPMSEERIQHFRDIFHREGFTKRQAESIISTLNDLEVQAWKGVSEAHQQKFDAAEQALKQDWGQAFDEKLQLAQQVADKKGDEFKEWMERNGLENDPMLIRMLAELGGTLQEPGLPSGGRPGGTGRLTPEAARERIAELKGDATFVKRWTNEHDPGHQAAVDEMSRLFQAAYPAKEGAR